MGQSLLPHLHPEASPALRAILDTQNGPLQAPLRAEIFGLQRFAEHGRSLGETHRGALPRSASIAGATRFFPRLQSNIRTLREAHRYLGHQAATGYDISPAAEWLLDNFHIIEAQLQAIHVGLPRSYFRDLPVLQHEPLAGLPRVYGVAWAFVAHTDGAFDETLLVQFLRAYQETCALSLSELWALPTTLRVVLIENLRRLAERVAANKAAREAANLCCDRLAPCNDSTLATMKPLLDALNQRGVGTVFLAQMAQRLQDRGASHTGRTDNPAPTTHAAWRAWAQQALPDLAAALTQQGADQAADNLSVSNAVRSLRAVDDADWPDIVARTSPLMQLMLTAPLFAAEDTASRDHTLHGIERWARRSGRGEVAVAQALLGLMHGGGPVAGPPPVRAAPQEPAQAAHWLHGAGRATLARTLGLGERSWLHLGLRTLALARRWALPAYLGAIGLGTLALVAGLLHGGAHLTNGLSAVGLAAVLMLWPASEAVVAVINRLISESAAPQHLPRLALLQGIPPAHRVMVVIPALLTDTASTRSLVHRLLLHQLANPEPHAQFALLTDWADADTPTLPRDADLLADAQRQIDALNARQVLPAGGAPRFLLLHRERRFSASEQRWIGWERKRGKLEQLVAALATGVSSAFLDLGDTSRVAADTRYIVTLDSDTQLPPGRLRELVGITAHPDNRPRLAADGRSVVAGYGILQPRIVTPLTVRHDPEHTTPSSPSHFHWLFAGQAGVDPYSTVSSEVYQDLFGEGTFCGKGLLDVQAMHAVLSGRLPEGQVLSHDLLEGALVRCAALSDVTLIEPAPSHADVAASRLHRWMRGDWQLLPLLLGPLCRPLRGVQRWKMVDNLRRSLVAPASLALLVLMLATDAVSPGAALAVVLAAYSAGPLMGALAGLVPSRTGLALGYFFRQAGIDLARAGWTGLWHLAQLQQQALQAADAVVRALYRTWVSRRHLLEWTTAAAAQAAAQTHLPALLSRHRREPALALLLLVVLWLAGTPWPGLAGLLCALWAASPVWTWWVSRPGPVAAGAALLPADRRYLETLARDTWRLFERCIGPDDRHLPPDNLQVTPHDMVAHRTSPTNIGLYLLSAACAREFGWIDTPELLRRLEATLATLHTLPRYRGHFLNWYDTQRSEPLLPMYVSTVDSGNLSGHLLAVAQACRALAADPVAGAEPAPQDTRVAPVAPDLEPRLRALAEAFETLAWEADFSFLYHPQRHLFHIGYRVAEQQLDAGFYDLLASESRLTSLLAIAKGDVPVRHWAALGRPFYAVGPHAGLRSWSGSMFEYLMPSLVLDEPQGSVLREACLAALAEQIAFAQTQSVPWGISECAHAGRDHTLAYQYAPQGVPRLALRRTPPDELVIAPYATALAALLAPHRACLNFSALEALATRERYGFIEALDFTPARQGGDEAFMPVGTFMAHHQGMTIVALANVLRGGVAQRWGMANPQLEAVASLLHERVPREVSMLFAPPAGAPSQTRDRRAPGLLREVLPGTTALSPTHLLGNGRYSVTLRANGAGWSRWGQAGITRWRDDALRDAHGSFFYLRRLGPGVSTDTPPPLPLRSPLVSLTQHPAPDPAAQYQSTFHADRVCFDTTWPDLQTAITVWVSPEDDIEFRQVELRNLGDSVLELELISAFEVTLADARADEAHPAFSNLFVRAQWQAREQALVFERQPRLASERGLLAAHFLVDSHPLSLSLRVQTDRQRWLGRNHDLSAPQAMLDALPIQGDGPRVPLETGLDPMCALAVRLRLTPQAKVHLTFATAASDHGGTLSAVIDKYRQPSHVQRASLMSTTLSGIRLRALRIGAEPLAGIQSLTTALVLSLTRPDAAPPDATTGDPVCDRRLLWRLGLSGDRPLIVVTAGVMEGLGLLRSLAQALRLWLWGGIACDLVVISTEPASYEMPLQRELAALGERHTADSTTRAGSGLAVLAQLHLLRADALSAGELSTLHALARLHLRADGRPLLHHLQAWQAWHEQAFDERLSTSTTAVAIHPAARQGVPAPTGRFDAVTGDFRFPVSARQRPVRPWINVLANPDFGALLSEAGGGYSWALNSRLNQLTAWSNDAVADPPSEWFLLQDRRSRDVWSVAPSAWGDAEVSYHVAHGQGLSRISHRRGHLTVTATWSVDADTAVKRVGLQFVNHGARTQQLRLIGIAEWLMGAQRSDRSTVQTAVHRQRLPAHKLTTLLCTQRDHAAGFGEGTAFLALADDNSATEDWTCDRRALFDARGRLVLPDHFDRHSGAGLDPCAALATPLNLGPGEMAERVFLLGYAASPDAARQLAAEAAVASAPQCLDHTRQRWDALLGATTVQTPDPLFDALVNRWLLYQTVSCRLWAKAGFYQAGGATGFRDQLQDTLALAWAAPGLLREQILRCAARQFAEGDVQHWWHAPTGAGVRTHFSDDLLWLPLACVRYLRATDDWPLLDQPVAFLEGAAIPEGAEDIYDTPRPSTDTAPVYEHAARTLDRSLRVGAHGLPLMGSGDWNDGMNRVGHEGRGESVWLGWFLCRLVADFAPIARARGDHERALRWENAARGWLAALLGPAWDGGWFKRAFFDNGQPLGSQANAEGRIDLIAQAWAVLSQVAPAPLQQQAMAAVEAHLVDTQAGLIRLLDPPLAHASPSAGYIQAYPPGVRENGGQYSHAGVWALMAQAELAQQAAPGSAAFDAAADRVYRDFTWLSPAHRSRDARQGAAYSIEPYAVAGDVYSQPPYVGRGGWSWYTGAAAWLHRAAVESIFGLQWEAQTLCFTPCLPPHWPQAMLTLRRDHRTLHFTLIRATAHEAHEAAAHAGADADLRSEGTWHLPAAARVLLPGERLRWPELTGDNHFVIPLQATRSGPA